LVSRALLRGRTNRAFTAAGPGAMLASNMSRSLPRAPARRALRVAVVTLAVVVLVPMWLARSAYLYACSMDREVSCQPCCGLDPGDEPRDPSAGIRAACCEADEIDLGAPRTAGATHADAAVPAPALVILAIRDDAPAAARAQPTVLVPRSTGPPPWLRNL